MCECVCFPLERKELKQKSFLEEQNQKWQIPSGWVHSRGKGEIGNEVQPMKEGEDLPAGSENTKGREWVSKWEKEKDKMIFMKTENKMMKVEKQHCNKGQNQRVMTVRTGWWKR